MTNRNEVIDFIRGISILLVILLHCKIHLPLEQSWFSINWVKWLFSSGYYGVMAFFVVSGFLITSTCIQRWGHLQSINAPQFYVMRFARIMPCLLALITVSSFLHLMNVKGFIIHNTSLKQTIFSALTFNMNWLESKAGYFPANWDVLWSLSVEEIFYLFFPIFCFVFRKQKYLIFIMLVFILIGPFARTKFTANDIWSDHSYLSCMDGIAIGCLSAMIADKLKSSKLSKYLLASGLSLFGFIFFFRKESFDLGITSLGLNVTILEISVAMIILATQQTTFKWFSVMRWFGKNSYEIYLTHSFVVLFVAHVLYRLNQPILLITLEYLIIVLCSGLLGQFIATFYSEPLNRYLRKNIFGYKLHYSDIIPTIPKNI